MLSIPTNETNNRISILFLFSIAFRNNRTCTSYLKGNISAHFYIVGYTFTFFSILLLILKMGGITFWSDLFTLYSFNIGLVFEIVIFSFAIGDRLKIIKEQKEDAEVRVEETQAKLNEQLRENEKLKDKVNNELKKSKRKNC